MCLDRRRADDEHPADLARAHSARGDLQDLEFPRRQRASLIPSGVGRPALELTRGDEMLARVEVSRGTELDGGAGAVAAEHLVRSGQASTALKCVPERSEGGHELRWRVMLEAPLKDLRCGRAQQLDASLVDAQEAACII